MKYFFYVLIFFALCTPRFVLAESLAADSDSDGLIDQQEINLYHTDPENADTDNDGFFDGDEIHNGYSPLFGDKKKLYQVDSDGDGLNDLLEIAFGTDLTKKDTDDDGISDYDEVMKGLNPLDPNREAKFVRSLEVNLSIQQMYYVVDNKRVLTIPVSTGNPSTPTPTGAFKIFEKVPVKRYRGADYDLPNVKWNMQFKPGYFIHSAYWHNDFGKKTRSHGCVNTGLKDAELLYKYIDIGVPVLITGTTPKKRVVGT